MWRPSTIFFAVVFASSQVALGQSQRLFNVRELGATADGAADDRAAIQRAVDATLRDMQVEYTPDAVIE